MTEIYERLSALSAHSEAVVTFVGLIATGFAWRYAGRPRPRVRLLALDVLILEIENIGKRVARNVELCFEPEYVPFEGKDRVYGTKNLGDMDNGQRYEFGMGWASGDEFLRQLGKTEISVSYKRRFPLRPKRSCVKLGGLGIAGSNSAEGGNTPIGKIATNTKALAATLKSLVTEVERIKDRIHIQPAAGGEGIPYKKCANCQWGQFAYHQHLPMAEFWCNNCDEVFRRSDSCECPGMWCEHTPAPGQCVRWMV